MTEDVIREHLHTRVEGHVWVAIYNTGAKPNEVVQFYQEALPEYGRSGRLHTDEAPGAYTCSFRVYGDRALPQGALIFTGRYSYICVTLGRLACSASTN